MFENIGEKIKKLAIAITVIGIVISVIYGITCFARGSAVDGVTAIGLGVLISWVSSFVLYGFGELISTSKEISESLARMERVERKNLQMTRQILKEQSESSVGDASPESVDVGEKSAE